LFRSTPSSGHRHSSTLTPTYTAQNSAFRILLYALRISAFYQQPLDRPFEYHLECSRHRGLLKYLPKCDLTHSGLPIDYGAVFYRIFHMFMGPVSAGFSMSLCPVDTSILLYLIYAILLLFCDTNKRDLIRFDQRSITYPASVNARHITETAHRKSQRKNTTEL